MKIKKETIFLSVLMVYFAAKYLEYTTIIRIDGVQAMIHMIKDTCYVLFLVMWGFKVIKGECLSKTYFIVLSVLILYFGYQACVKNRPDIFGVILCSLNFKQRYFKRYLKKVYILSIFLFLMTIVMSVAGIIQNEVAIGNKWGIKMIRAGSGFTYAGQLAMMLIPIVFLYYYLYQRKHPLISNMIWISADVAIFP